MTKSKILLFTLVVTILTSFAYSQDTPIDDPIIVPPGGLDPVGDLINNLPLDPNLPNLPIHMIPGRLMKCNLLQIRKAQAPLWRRSLEAIGVSEATTNTLLSEISTLTSSYCSSDISIREPIAASARGQRIMLALGSEISDFLDVPIDAAIEIMQERLFGKFREIQEACYESGEFGKLATSRLALTPQSGWSSDFAPNPAFATVVAGEELLGPCGSGSPRSASIGLSDISADGRGVNMAAVNACMDNFEDQYNCDSPVAQDRTETYWRAAREECTRTEGCEFSTEDGPGGGTIQTLSMSEPDEHGTQIAGTTEWNADGELTHYNFSTVRQADDGAVVHNFQGTNDPRNFLERTIIPVTDVLNTIGDFYDALDRAFPFAPTPGDLDSFREFLPKLVKPGGSSQRCVPFNSTTSRTVLGYAKPANSGGLLVRPSLSVPDAFAYCMCKGGRGGKEIANLMGYGCGGGEHIEWQTRMDCLDNPYGGPAGGIRPECLRYLEEDVGIDVVRENLEDICETHMTCPEGASLATTTGDLLACDCRTGRYGGARGGGAEQPPPRCLTVDCSLPEGETSDCCKTVLALPELRNYRHDLLFNFDPVIRREILDALGDVNDVPPVPPPNE